MRQTFSIKEKIKLLLVVLVPILVTQVGMFGMNFIDTVMSGQAGPDDLAGVAIGSSIWLPIFTGLSGILIALTPMISHYIGAEENHKVGFTVIQGLYLAMIISIIIIIAGLFLLEPFLSLMSLTDEVHHIAKHYLVGFSLGILPLFIHAVFRGFIDSLGQTRITMIVTLLALPVNVVFNYILIFGKLGFPALGGIGAGYASAITYVFILAVTLYFVIKVHPFSDYQLLRTFYKVSLSKWKEILLLGLPIGLTIFFETSIFAAVTLLMSQFNTATIAAHQAAINFASLLYMVPMSIAFSLTIVVGYEVGAKRLKDAKQYSYLGVSTAILFSVVAAIILFYTRESVSLLYTNDVKVAMLIQSFLIYAIFFQLSDALVTPIQGVLRGHKDVNIPFVMALISFWVIGLPTGFVLANYTTYGPYGYWIGLIAGLGAGAIALSWRWMHVQRKKEQEVQRKVGGNNE
ncbi:MATE family efflux transporter [Bacillus alkalicellulosilyticus]|uniref:MATE family efflux transporter n=1 Tax=Alkalihalobacterium alkalicellulosilyticum TaxID=1912214 RepID=UPI0009986AA4|nr:MATE family efflux transporter [Bacillus alkalicellulosilyticus]